MRIELIGGALLARLAARARTLLFPALSPAGTPSRADAAFQLGFSLHREGRLDEAAGFYAEALALAPGHAPALNFLGMLIFQRDEAVRAVELLSAAVAIDPGQPGFHSNL
ncbi:MAG: tetratricopeptide repeat protein, partial [Betaproteobacteria bacterium]